VRLPTRSRGEALNQLAGLILEDGRTWGAAATKVQRADAEAILDADAKRRFHFITRARGYSKTTDLGACAIAVLLAQAPPASKSYAVAADQAQARLLLDAVEGFVRRTPGLSAALDVAAWKITSRSSGASLEALAADSAGVWGLLPYFVVADELCEWGTTGAPKRIWEAITSAMPKTGGRLVAITTAGSPSHWAKRVRDHAEKDKLWRLSETKGPPPWMPQELLDEQRRRLLPSSFARLFQNEWTSAEDSLVDADDLRACVVLDGPLPPEAGRRYVVAVDLGIKRDASVAVVAHAENVTTVPPGEVEARTVAARVVLDRIEVWRGSRERPVELRVVEAWIREASAAYLHAQVVLDPWQGIGLAQRLRSAGVRVEEFTFSAQSVGRIAATLHRLLRDRLLALPDDEELLDELANVRLRETAPGVVRMDHDSDKHDDRAIALAMAAAVLLERPVGNVGEASTGGDGDMRAVLGDREALADRSGQLAPGLSYGMDF